MLEARSGLDLDLRQENNVSEESKVGLDWVLVLDSESVLFAELITASAQQTPADILFKIKRKHFILFSLETSLDKGGINSAILLVVC